MNTKTSIVFTFTQSIWKSNIRFIIFSIMWRIIRFNFYDLHNSTRPTRFSITVWIDRINYLMWCLWLLTRWHELFQNAYLTASSLLKKYPYITTKNLTKKCWNWKLSVNRNVICFAGSLERFQNDWSRWKWSWISINSMFRRTQVKYSLKLKTASTWSSAPVILFGIYRFIDQG